jgi:putative adhesin
MNVSIIIKKQLVFICLFIATLAVGQNEETTLQVVSKNIEKTVDYKAGYVLDIDGEKADIQIATWDKNKVKVVIELIAKHENLEVAKRDLESMGYNIEVVGKKIFVRNYILAKEGSIKPESIFKANYVLTIPEDCPVDLRNHFGKANIKDLNQSVDVKSEFCEIKLENIEGRIGIETRFGDVEGRHLGGQMKIESIRSDITLSQIKGPIDINAKYGKIKIDANNSLLDLNIIAEKTDIVFLNPAKDNYDFDLTAHYGNVTVPEGMNFEFKAQNSTLNKAELNLPKQEGMVSIKTSFGNIVVVRVE